MYLYREPYSGGLSMNRFAFHSRSHFRSSERTRILQSLIFRFLYCLRDFFQYPLERPFHCADFIQQTAHYLGSFVRPSLYIEVVVVIHAASSSVFRDDLLAKPKKE